MQEMPWRHARPAAELFTKALLVPAAVNVVYLAFFPGYDWNLERIRGGGAHAW